MNDIRLCNKGNTIDGQISITFFHYYLKKTSRIKLKKELILHIKKAIFHQISQKSTV